MVRTEKPDGRTQDGSALRLVSWNLTQRCNLRCKHCYIDATASMSDELGTDEALHLVDEIAEVAPETLLILSGGEPLLRRDLDTIVARASGFGMTVVLGTNGTLLTNERAYALAKRGLAGVGISLDSLVPSRHDTFRGVPGTWRCAVRGIEAARQAGLDVQIQMTLTRDNAAELSRAVGFARGMGVRVLTIFFLVCTGRGQDLVDLAPQEYERVLKQLVELQPDGVMIRPRCAPTFRRILTQSKPESILLHSDAGRCLAAKSYCRVTPDGTVTPCPYMPLAAGTLAAQSFPVIWHSAPLFQRLRSPSLQGRCRTCEYRTGCGGCRARALALNGDPLAEDPWCTYAPGTDGPLLESAEKGALAWTAEAEKRIEAVPPFVRRVVRRAVETFARRRGCAVVTPELLEQARRFIRQG